MKRFYLSLFLLVFSQLHAGLVWKTRVTSTSEDSKPSSMLIKGSAQSGNVRQDFIEMKNQDGFKEGTWMLLKSGSAKAQLVNPEEKNYMEIDPAGMLSSMNSMMKIELSDVKVTSEVLPSEKIGSWNCTHIRMKISYKIEVKMMMITTVSKVEQVKEIWSTKDISASDISETFIKSGFKSGMPELDLLIEKESKVTSASGFPVKTRVEDVSVDAKNNSKKTITITMLESAVKQDVAASTFEIPKNYEKIDLSAINMNAPSEERDVETSVDDKKSKKTQKNQPAEKNDTSGSDYENEDDEESTPKAVKSILRGLF